MRPRAGDDLPRRRPDDLLRFDDKGSLVRQAYRPVFEAAVTYEPATGGIEVIANDKATRGEIVKATVTHLLGIAFKEPSTASVLRPLRASDALRLGGRPGGRDRGCRVARAAPHADRRQQPKGHTGEHGPRGRYHLVHGGRDVPGAHALARRFRHHAGQTGGEACHAPKGRPPAHTHAAITWPHGCDLKDRTATEQMIGEKYLRRRGILFDDLQLFED